MKITKDQLIVLLILIAHPYEMCYIGMIAICTCGKLTLPTKKILSKLVSMRFVEENIFTHTDGSKNGTNCYAITERGEDFVKSWRRFC